MPLNQFHSPKAWEKTIEAGSTFGGPNRIAIPGTAFYTQITNEESHPITVRLNGDGYSDFTLPGSCTQIFSEGDLHIISIDFANTQSGATETSVQVICGVVANP